MWPTAFLGGGFEKEGGVVSEGNLEQVGCILVWRLRLLLKPSALWVTVGIGYGMMKKFRSLNVLTIVSVYERSHWTQLIL